MTKAKQSIRKICEYCGKEFDAWRITTRCCSDYCNKRAYKQAKRKKTIEATETITADKKVGKIKTDLSERQYLSISEVARLMSVSRWTVYRYVVSGVIPCIRINKRVTRIKRSDLDLLFENANPYEVLPAQERKPIADWYTLSEITEKYGIKYRRLRDIINSENIPEKRDGKITLIAKNRIDAYFKKQGYNETIMNLSEWLVLQEVREQYNMTENAAYSFLSENNIPKKQQGGQRYYSKLHIDKVKNKGQ
ncbi:MAG: helix-turn-helix domain-containing protein [Bacteroidales bacterium]|jgi:excisionase family DNA binding protein|nr:helix-turn-helix domain-containing protein [Bacteroidales bacterium]